MRIPDGRYLFRDAGLELYPGERVVITGATGSGKSTFFKLITGLERPSAGSVYIFGKDLNEMGLTELNSIRTRLGMIFSHSVLVSNLKVIENVALPLLYHRNMPRDEAMLRAQSLLNYVGYIGDFWNLPGCLPGYLERLVLIARAMALEPDVIACENPSAGLRPSEGEHVTDLLRRFHSMDRKRLLVVTTSNEADIRLVRPGRVIKIEDAGFREASTPKAGVRAV